MHCTQVLGNEGNLFSWEANFQNIRVVCNMPSVTDVIYRLLPINFRGINIKKDYITNQNISDKYKLIILAL